jgi:hypothetical protein
MKTFKTIFAIVGTFAVLGLTSCTKQDLSEDEILIENDVQAVDLEKLKRRP